MQRYLCPQFVALAALALQIRSNFASSIFCNQPDDIRRPFCVPSPQWACACPAHCFSFPVSSNLRCVCPHGSGSTEWVSRPFCPRLVPLEGRRGRPCGCNALEGVGRRVSDEVPCVASVCEGARDTLHTLRRPPLECGCTPNPCKYINQSLRHTELGSKHASESRPARECIHNQ